MAAARWRGELADIVRVVALVDAAYATLFSGECRAQQYQVFFTDCK
jgi:hypothetical protein